MFARDKQSRLRLYGEHNSSCGYCKSEDTSISYGAVAESLSCEDYQDLIDRGWRRSGTYLYKPTMHQTCCPQYSIRLEVCRFIPSKNQKHVLKKLSKESIGSVTTTVTEDSTPNFKHSSREQDEIFLMKLEANILDALESAAAAGHLQAFDKSSNLVKVTRCKKTEHGDYASAVAFRIASLLQQNKKGEFNAVDISKIVCDHFRCNSVEVKPVNGFLNFSVSEGLNVLASPERKSETAGPKLKLKTNVDVKAQDNQPKAGATLALSIRRSVYDEEVFALYKKYQTAVHNDSDEKITKESFERFLVHSPLIIEGGENYNLSSSGNETILNTIGEPFEITEEMVKVPFGTYHMLYRHNDKLIAVGVVDVLPRCLSSVYLFYDPEYRYLTLGKVTALKEIEWSQRAALYRPQLCYYYLGFYIHSCQKMKYKAEYRPSELLCPQSYSWVDLNKCVPLLNASKYSSFCERPREQPLESENFQAISAVPLDIGHRSNAVLFYDDLAEGRGKEMVKELLNEYVHLVSSKTAERCIIHLR